MFGSLLRLCICITFKNQKSPGGKGKEKKKTYLFVLPPGCCSHTDSVASHWCFSDDITHVSWGQGRKVIRISVQGPRCTHRPARTLSFCRPPNSVSPSASVSVIWKEAECLYLHIYTIYSHTSAASVCLPATSGGPILFGEEGFQTKLAVLYIGSKLHHYVMFNLILFFAMFNLILFLFFRVLGWN